MKKFMALLAALLIMAAGVVPAFAASPAVRLDCDKTAEGDILYVNVSFSGCEGLTSADLRFDFDASALTFLGASLTGAVQSDDQFIGVFSDQAGAAQSGSVRLSMIHIDGLSAEEGEDALCQLAFRAGQGSSKIKASAKSFRINDKDVSASMGSCRYSAGAGNFFKTYGAVLLICGVALVVILVLVILLIVVRRIKKNTRVNVVPFADTPQADDDAVSAADQIVLHEPETEKFAAGGVPADETGIPETAESAQSAAEPEAAESGEPETDEAEDAGDDGDVGEPEA